MTVSDSPTGALPSRLQYPDLGRSLWQVANSFIPFVLICAILYATPHLSWWVRPVLWVVAAGFLIRIFIIQHDCGHGAFFRSRRHNDYLGWVCSLFTLAPYAQWRRHHAQHHGNWNNLDRRGGVDLYVTCMTLDEYAVLPRWAKARYRLVRSPLISLILLPPLVFIGLYRIPFDSPQEKRRERIGVYLTTLGFAAQLLILGWAFGFSQVLATLFPISAIAATVGVWLFSLQHRFEFSWWARQASWTADDAALQGSSYLKLPRILQWFTGNIGFHHVHHFNPRVPNYRLEACHNALPTLQGAPVLSLWVGLNTWRYALWDEVAGVMVPFPKPVRAG
jgi:omega-6 fatty acid desaturase (delta-12 desaturase)